MTIKEYKVFVASPGDTAEERAFLQELAEEINDAIGHANNFRIRTIKWENDLIPGMGLDGQDVINKQVDDDYDVFVGIMWKKFGTPTGRAGSGTEEEFERAYAKYQNGDKVEILFYFNQADIPMSQIDTDQINLVKKFKSKIGDLGTLYSQYTGIDDFKKKIRSHLTKTLLRIHQSFDGKALNMPKSIESTINEGFFDYLSSTKVVFAHSSVDEIYFEDIFVAPDLKDNSKVSKEGTFKDKNLEELSSAIDQEGIKYLFIGYDLSGRSASCKYLYIRYLNLGLFPVLLNGKDFNNNITPKAIIRSVNKAIESQYETKFVVEEIDSTQLLVIIDDFHKSAKGNSRYWPTLMKNLETIFPNLILTGTPLMPLENISKRNPFDNFETYTILEFGPIKRAEIVNKWNTLGVEEKFQDRNELFRKNEEALSHIKSIIGKNYVPSYPFYILSILQALEGGKKQNPDYSIHGFYYEMIINDSLARQIQDRQDVSFYYNFLTYLCYFLFDEKKKVLTNIEFSNFHKAYQDKHEIPSKYTLSKVLKTLDASKVLNVSEDSIGIRENYIYYFFVGKFIANNINKEEFKSELHSVISRMSERVFRDEYASIIMFLTHLSKDEFIINKLLDNAELIFKESPVIQLNSDVSVINEMVKSLPSQILEMIDVKEKRNEELENEEEDERFEKEFEKEQRNYDQFDLDENTDEIDLYAKITLALKTIDILGQIAKKHWGELDGEQKYKIVDVTYKLGLRTLGYYLKMIENNAEIIVEHIGELIERKHIKDRFTLQKSVEDSASSYVFKLCFMASFGIIKRISNAIGYDNLKTSFEKVLLDNNYNSVRLIDLSVKLGYQGIPFDDVSSHHQEMQKFNLSHVVLQNLVIDHMYMYETDYKDKAKACNTLGISMKDQRKINATSKVKRD